MSPPRVVLLGPQFHRPTVGETLSWLGVRGRVATITAGWQEREAEDQGLRKQVGKRVLPLRLYERAEAVWAADPELVLAHRGMQSDLRVLRRLYQLRLEHAATAWFALLDSTEPDHLLLPEREAAIETVRELDARLLARIRARRAEFEAEVALADRPSISPLREAVAREMASVEAVVIEGGHIPSLLNRLLLFGVPELLAGKTVIGCAGGAMVLCGRVVLFDDDPAVGHGHAEVALPGLGLAPGIVAFPDASHRLRVDHRERMMRLSLRLSPDRCALLDPGARLSFDGSKWTASEARRVELDGTVLAWEAAA